jgi:nitroreductase
MTGGDAPVFNDRADTLALLRTRRSGKARDMQAPGPTEAQLEAILSAAIRVPDHGKLAPWRLVVIDDRQALAELLQRLYQAEKPEAGRLELEAMAQFARQAPCLVVLLSEVKESHIPRWEQELSAGAVAQTLLIAAHAQGFVGNWLTGAAAYLAGLPAALGVPGGRVAGFFFLGAPARALEERPRPDPTAVIRRWPG